MGARGSALAVDAAAVRELDTLWDAVLAGRWRIVHRRCTAERIEWHVRTDAGPVLSSHRREIAERQLHLSSDDN